MFLVYVMVGAVVMMGFSCIFCFGFILVNDIPLLMILVGFTLLSFLIGYITVRFLNK